MKARDSGMPEEGYWNSLFDAEGLVRRMLGPEGCPGDLVELGCGYGTFTLPAARQAAGTVLALDIEAGLIERLHQRCRDEGIPNVRAEVRDFVADGTGLAPETQAHAMIYNLLHLERPVELLREACRVLALGGRLSVIHWRRDIPTPRGPSMDIRPGPEQCREWMADAGFRCIQEVDVSDCCRFHYGIVAVR